MSAVLAVTSASMLGYERHKKKSKKLVVSAAFSAAKMGYKKHTTKVSRMLAVPDAILDSLKGYVRV